MRMRGFTIVIAVVSIFGPAACGDSNSGTSSTPVLVPATMASFRLDVSGPKQAIPSDDPERPWLVFYSLMVTERGGLSGNIDYFNTTIVSPLGGQSECGNVGADFIVYIEGTNHVRANGDLKIVWGGTYGPGGGNPAFLLENIDMHFTDERGNKTVAHAQGKILAPESTSGSSSILWPSYVARCQGEVTRSLNPINNGS